MAVRSHPHRPMPVSVSSAGKAKRINYCMENGVIEALERKARYIRNTCVGWALEQDIFIKSLYTNIREIKQ